MSCCTTSVQIWLQSPELLLYSEMEEDSPLKLAFEIGPNAPDVLALPAELVCDPCQNCSCQHESTPATGLLSANDFSIVLGSEANYRMKHSPLKRIHVTMWFCSIKMQDSLEPSQALTLSSGSNILKLIYKPQDVLRSLVTTGFWYIHYRQGSICTSIKEAVLQVGPIHFISRAKL